MTQHCRPLFFSPKPPVIRGRFFNRVQFSLRYVDYSVMSRAQDEKKKRIVELHMKHYSQQNIASLTSHPLKTVNSLKEESKMLLGTLGHT